MTLDVREGAAATIAPPQAASRLKPDLSDLVAVVVSGTGGIGHTVAAVLGEAGATVYVADPRCEPHLAAGEVTARGGRGIAVAIKDLSDAALASLFARVRREQGRLHLLVTASSDRSRLRDATKPFWQVPRDDWRAAHDVLLTHLAAVRHAVPLLLEATGTATPLVVSAMTGSCVRGGNAIDAATEAATLRALASIGEELQPYGVAALAIAPSFAVPAASSGTAHVVEAESPEYLARAIAHATADPHVLEKSGQLVSAGQLAAEYGFTDIDATQPNTADVPNRWSHS